MCSNCAGDYEADETPDEPEPETPLATGMRDMTRVLRRLSGFYENESQDEEEVSG